MNQRNFLGQRWAALAALFKDKQYRALTAFTEEREAERFRDELRKKGIDVITAKQPQFLRHDISGLVEAVEVQVAAEDFSDACKHIRDANRPMLPRQFSLRAVLILLTIACIVLALIHQFGVFGTFWGVVFLSLGGSAIGWAVVGARRGRASWSWPRTRGTIVQSYVDWDGENYSPKIGYRFSNGGREYAVDIISYKAIDISGARAGHELARRSVAKYPVGLEVDVFYDPAEPSHAVLERGRRLRDAVLFATAGGAFVTLGFLMLFGVVGP